MVSRSSKPSFTLGLSVDVGKETIAMLVAPGFRHDRNHTGDINPHGWVSPLEALTGRLVLLLTQERCSVGCDGQQGTGLVVVTGNFVAHVPGLEPVDQLYTTLIDPLPLAGVERRLKLDGASTNFRISGGGCFQAHEPRELLG